MDAFVHALCAFGPLSALGLASPITIAYARKHVLIIPLRWRNVLWFFLLSPPFFILLKLSVDVVLAHATYIPIWMGTIFYVVWGSIGTYLVEWWKPVR